MSIVYQVSDCHLSDEASYHHLAKALTLIAKDKCCEAILLTGDLCCGPKPGDYKRLADFIFDHLSVPNVYAIAGNHDELALMKSEFAGRIKTLDSARIGGRDFIFIDSSQKPVDTKHPLGSGRVSNKGMAKLAKLLRKKHNPIAVIHHPVIRVGSEWMKAICLENDNKVLNTLSKSGVQSVLCGHGHAFIVAQSDNVTQYMAPATAYGFDHSILEYNRSPNIGLSRIKLSKTTINVKEIVLCASA